jgi:archaellum component FlaC
MQTSVQAPQAPARPQPQIFVRGQGPQTTIRVPGITISTGDAGGDAISIPTPRTKRDIDALNARRDELSNQLQSVDGRRLKLIGQLKQTGDPTAIKGLQDRLALLDARQLQLESDIQTTGQQLTSPAAGLIASTEQGPFPGGLGTGQVMGLSVLTIIFVLFPLAVGVGRSIWKRSSRPAPPVAALAESAQRLERLEGSVDAIALEIERISEGQRFVTKLLSETQPAPILGAGQRTPETVRGS